MFFQRADLLRQFGQTFEHGCRTVVLHAREGGVSEADFVVGNVLVESALRADLHAVADGDVVGDAHLPREEAVAADLRSSRDAGLGRRHGVLADLHVMADLDQVVEFHAPADDGRVGLGAVDAGVGADLHVVLDHHVAQLGNLVESARSVGHEPESVGADHRPCVEDAVRTHDTAFVDLDAGHLFHDILLLCGLFFCHKIERCCSHVDSF